MFVWGKGEIFQCQQHIICLHKVIGTFFIKEVLLGRQAISWLKYDHGCSKEVRLQSILHGETP